MLEVFWFQTAEIGFQFPNNILLSLSFNPQKCVFDFHIRSLWLFISRIHSPAFSCWIACPTFISWKWSPVYYFIFPYSICKVYRLIGIFDFILLFSVSIPNLFTLMVDLQFSQFWFRSRTWCFPFPSFQLYVSNPRFVFDISFRFRESPFLYSRNSNSTMSVPFFNWRVSKFKLEMIISMFH